MTTAFWENNNKHMAFSHILTSDNVIKPGFLIT